nr:unnamed protein product [Callosobruchus analis]
MGPISIKAEPVNYQRGQSQGTSSSQGSSPTPRKCLSNPTVSRGKKCSVCGRKNHVAGGLADSAVSDNAQADCHTDDNNDNNTPVLEGENTPRNLGRRSQLRPPDRYENECLSHKYDDVEQASRINNLRIFRVKEKPQEKLTEEVINIIKSHLGVTVDNNEILCVRIGKKVNNKPRGILLKLSSIHRKQDIFNKKNFKGTCIVIKEDLTDQRLKMMEAAIEKTSLKCVWTYNGHVFVLKDGKKIMIKSKEDLDRL